jgi:putative nucleotidyltransferase with HDIG domain
MRLVATKTVKSGSILGKPIFNDKGQALLNEGVKLENRLLLRLLKMGIDYIFIKDSKTDDIVLKNNIPEKLRREAVKTIETTFQQLQQTKGMSPSLVIEKSSKQFRSIIRNLLDELKHNQLISLLSEVYVYDNYIYSHSLNVTLYSIAIGFELKLPIKEIEILALGAILHDVGKMKIPESILLKAGRLTESEYDAIKKHAEEGFRILKSVQTLPLLVAHCALSHHERLNGSGYPRGIKSQDIHLYAKIIAVADVFDAVTSNRVYRQAMLPHEGLEIIYGGSGILFDPIIVDAFRKSVVIYPNGLTVVLNDGRKGVVAGQNVGLSERPIIRVIEVNGKSIDEPYDIDLKRELTLVITSCDTADKTD